ncbi:MAG: hypothetical protein LBP67_04135 [Bacteroidales bacterium]|jgi:tRNA(Ile)-lysidine synthase TilS/MesJ|nr:hypothetical protein [Bacteroidales bacterium]
MIVLKHNKNTNKWFSGKVLRVIKDFNLIEDNEIIAVGLSGGVDSITLLLILEYIRRFSHINFKIIAVHVQVYDKHDTKILEDYCKDLDVEFMNIYVDDHNLPVPDKGICYTCSKLRKGALVEHLKARNINKVAFGHHADDLLETLLMNMDYHKLLDTLMPFTFLDRTGFYILRPMLCLSKKEIIKIHKYFELPLADFNCKYEEKNRREVFRDLVNDIDEKLPDFSNRAAESVLNFLKKANKS